MDWLVAILTGVDIDIDGGGKILGKNLAAHAFAEKQQMAPLLQSIIVVILLQ
jgi:hypothetical protein